MTWGRRTPRLADTKGIGEWGVWLHALWRRAIGQRQHRYPVLTDWVRRPATQVYYNGKGIGRTDRGHIHMWGVHAFLGPDGDT